MSEYLIQDKTMVAMADHMRRISGTEDELTGAEIAEIFSRTQGTLKTTGEHQVKAVDLAGYEEKSGMYDTDEVFALPKSSRDFVVQGQNGLETIAKFKCWSTTSPITNGYVTIDDLPVLAGAIMESVDDLLYICIETIDANTEVTIGLHIYKGGSIDWGDGTIDTITTTTSQHTHTYANVGSYIIKSPDSGFPTPFTQKLAYTEETIPVVKHVVIPSWGHKLLSTFVEHTRLETVILADGVTVFSDCLFGLFERCASLTCVVLPHTITQLTEHMFLGYSKYKYEEGYDPDFDPYHLYAGVKNVVIPYGITSIPYGCFNSNRSLGEVALPKSIANIGDGAFANAGLRSLVIPDGVISIGDSVFADATADCIVVPSTVTNIGSNAFAYSDIKQANRGIKSLVILCNNVPSIASDTFDLSNGVQSYAPDNYIYVLDELVDDYKSDTNWSTQASRIKPLSEYTGSY